jgi:hypothetical protein
MFVSLQTVQPRTETVQQVEDVDEKLWVLGPLYRQKI